eukprot:m.251479 g.251479  ORF g.251479 m.251479 type:complete len:288 (+) comp54513_c0_seq7:95-958(+)
MNVLITGGSSGLGKALALKYSAKGANVLLTARRLKELKEVAAECVAAGAKSAHVFPADVGSPVDCQNLAKTAAEVFPAGIHYLVINAGIGMRSRVDQLQDITVYQKLFDVNILGAIYVTHYCLPLVTKAKGHLIVISSVSGLLGLPGLAGYCASKAALHGFFDALRNEGPVGVTVVCPGFMDTDMPKKNMSADGSPVASHDSMDRFASFLVVARLVFCWMVGERCYEYRGKAWDPAEVASVIIQAGIDRRRDVVFDRSIKLALLLRHWIPSFIDTIIRRRFSSHSKL